MKKSTNILSIIVCLFSYIKAEDRKVYGILKMPKYKASQISSRELEIPFSLNFIC